MTDGEKPAAKAAAKAADKTPTGKPAGDRPVSPCDSAERDVVFHYSRERRLLRASPEVRALNEGTLSRTGFLKTMFATNSSRMLVFVILFTFAASALAFRFMGLETENGQPQYQGLILGRNTLAITIYPIEDMLFLVILKNAPESGELFTGAVDIAVSPVSAAGEESPQVFTHRVFFSLLEFESFQISLPFYKENDFFVVLQTEEEQRAIRVRVDNRA